MFSDLLLRLIPKNNVLWLEYASKDSILLIRLDLTNNTFAPYKNTLNMETLNFDPVTGLLVGIGLEVISPTEFNRVFVSLDSTTNALKVVSKIPGYFIIWSALGALDSVSRKYYCLLQPVGKQTLPFQLVEYDMNQNTVTNHPNIGGKFCSSCPWSMHYKQN